MRVRKELSVLLIITLIVGQILMLQGTAGMQVVEAATASCTTYSGTNVEAQDYSKASSPIMSYLSVCEDGKLMRVQYGGQIDGVLVEYYDASYNLLSSRQIPEELPLFGAFYETGNYYFLLTGQTNWWESPDIEVYRITKYDKNWNRITSVGLYDCNTIDPFWFGSARMDVNGDTLVIRTCHRMYKSADDGLNHQANVTIEMDMDTMEITYSYTDVGYLGVGYVSHSFNQFVKVDNGNIITVDHGDAYPRSLIMRESSGVTTEIMAFPGAIGENTTGAAIGGFEVSESHYLVAGHSVVQDDANLTRETRNVFVAAVPKSTSEVNINWLTAYGEGDGTTSTPQMVKIDNSRFVVLWSRDNNVYYTEVNGDGTANGTTYSMKGNLSDCVPVIYNNNIVWYTWNGGMVVFYEINLNDLSQTHVETIQNGHRYENKGIAEGNIILKCSVCNEEISVPQKSSLEVWWNEDGEGSSYYRSFTSDKGVGDVLRYWTYGMNGEAEVIISDPEVISYTPTSIGMGELTMLKPGKSLVIIRSLEDPQLTCVADIRVWGEYESGDINNDRTVNLLDLMLCMNHVSKKSLLADKSFLAADIDGNGIVNLLDLMRILNYVSKKINGVVEEQRKYFNLERKRVEGEL